MKTESAEHKEKTIHRCKLVYYGYEEKRCVKCGYITWSSRKSDIEIIEDMIKAGYDAPACSLVYSNSYPK